MTTIRHRLPAATTLGLMALHFGCSSSGGESAQPDEHTDWGTGGAVSAAGSASGSESGGSTGSPEPNPGPIDLGVGNPGSPSGSGGEPLVPDGGLLPLTPEQVSSVVDGECTGLSAQAESIPPVIQLVVDISDSMLGEAPGNEPSTKWDVTQTALLTALDGLAEEVFVGLQFFPTNSSGGFGQPGVPGGQQPQAAACVDDAGRVPIAAMGAAGSPQRAALSTAITSTLTYRGTPTHDAYQIALEESLKPYMGGGRKFMLLITDGAPTQELGCGPNIIDIPVDHPMIRDIIDNVTTAYAEGISTFVIGSPGSENGSPPPIGDMGIPGGMQQMGADMRPWLSEAARVGGTAAQANCMDAGPNFCHFDMTQTTDFSAALAQTLGDITMQVSATCDFAIPDDPNVGDIDPSLTNVLITWSDGTSVLAVRDEIADCTDGWIWGPAGEIQLCNATCEKYKADAGAKVTVSLGCETIIR